jgi:transposase
MLQLTPHHRILLALKPTDFRKGIDSLVGMCRQQLSIEPFSGHVFVFINRGRTALKLLVYDGQGFWLCMKRLSRGRFKWWPTPEQATCTLSASELGILLYNGNPKAAQIADSWRPLLPS